MDWNNVGSGSPNFGSGFVNFDRFMTPEGVAWGKDAPATWNKDQGTWNYESPQTDWSLRTPYDEWMINAGKGPKPIDTGGEDGGSGEEPPIDEGDTGEPDYTEDWMNSPLYNKLSQLHPDQEPQMPKGWKPTAKKPTVAKPPARVPTEEEITGHPYLPGTGPQIQPGQVPPPPSYTTPQYQYPKQSASGYPTLDKYLTGAWE